MEVRDALRRAALAALLTVAIVGAIVVAIVLARHRTQARVDTAMILSQDEQAVADSSISELPEMSKKRQSASWFRVIKRVAVLLVCVSVFVTSAFDYEKTSTVIAKVVTGLLLLYSSASFVSDMVDSTPHPAALSQASIHPLHRAGFTCHDPARLAESAPMIADAFRQKPQVRFRRINVKYPVLRTFLKGVAHHDWIQVAEADHPEDERPLACFDPRLSDKEFNDVSMRRRNGCWMYQERAKVLRKFLAKHLRLDQKQHNEAERMHANQWFAETAKVLSFVALTSADEVEFEAKLRQKKITLNVLDSSPVQPELEKVQLFQDVALPNLSRLFEAASCVMPMYGELGVQGHGIEDHLRYGRLEPFSVESKDIADTFYSVHPNCARLAVSTLIPLSLTKYDNSLVKSSVRVLAHKNDFDKLGCSNPNAKVNCQVFPRCWQMSLERILTSGQYPECTRPY